VVEEPHILSLLYVTQHHLSLSSPYSQPFGGGWYDAGTTASFGVKEVLVDHGNGTRRLFVRWEGDLRLEQAVGSVRMEKPLNLRAEWRKENRLTLHFYDSQGVRGVVPTKVVLESAEGDRLEATSFESIWLKPGVWRLKSARWAGAEVAPEPAATFDMNQPSESSIRLKVYELTIRFTDMLTLPIPELPVTVTLTNGTTLKLVTDRDGTISLGLVPAGVNRLEASLLGQSITRQFQSSSVKLEFTVPFSYTSLLVLLLSVVGVAGILAYRYMRRRTSATS
jgi:hypothetical protein